MFNLSYRHFAMLGLIAGILLVQACGRPVDPETGCNFVQNAQLQRVSWSQGAPIDLYVDDSVPSEYMTGIETAVAKWNALGEDQFKMKFFKLTRQNAGSGTPSKDGYSKIYLMNTWEANKQTEQARTTIYWSGDRIYEADIRLNEKDFDFFTGETPDYSKVHLESLMVHELGHVLGLAHTGNENSVMQVSLANGKLREDLSGFDVNSLACEYGTH